MLRRRHRSRLLGDLAMRSFGIFLIVMAIGSAVLPYVGMQFILVAWVDHWGSTIGWVIRGALLVIGIGLMGLATRQPTVGEPTRP